MDVNFQRTFQYEHSIHFCELLAACSGWNTEMDKGQSVHEGRERERERESGREVNLSNTSNIAVHVCVIVTVVCVCVRMYLSIHVRGNVDHLCSATLMSLTISSSLLRHWPLPFLAPSFVCSCALSAASLSPWASHTDQAAVQVDINTHNKCRSIHSTRRSVYTHTTYTTYTECSSR